jgi:hypothetical protein
LSQYFAWFGLPGSFVLTCLISLLALVLALIFRTSDRFIAAGAMFICSVGDIFMMDWNGVDTKVTELTGFGFTGPVLFMIGHLMYFWAFMILLTRFGHRFLGDGTFYGLGICTMTFIIMTALFIMRPDRDIPTYILGMIYLMVIGLAMLAVFSFTFAEGKWRLISAVGIMSFFLSDFIIGLGWIGGINYFDQYIWWLYPIGQILLLIGA